MTEQRYLTENDVHRKLKKKKEFRAKLPLILHFHFLRVFFFANQQVAAAKSKPKSLGSINRLVSVPRIFIAFDFDRLPLCHENKNKSFT